MSFDDGYRRTMKVAEMAIGVSPDQPFQLGVAAKNEGSSYLGPAVLTGAASAGVSGAVAGGAYRGLTGEGMLDTGKRIHAKGFEQAKKEMAGRNHGNLTKARNALLTGTKPTKALDLIDWRQMGKSFGRGAVGTGLTTAALGALSSLGQYGVGKAVTEEPDMKDRVMRNILG